MLEHIKETVSIGFHFSSKALMAAIRDCRSGVHKLRRLTELASPALFLPFSSPSNKDTMTVNKDRLNTQVRKRLNAVPKIINQIKLCNIFTETTVMFTL